MKCIPNVPPLIKEGDRVVVIAPSGRIDRDITGEAIKIIVSWGLNVAEGNNLYKREGIFAGSDDERLADLQDALDNPLYGAIFCARGGYGLSRIIDRLDFTRFSENPKWIIGYSDITLLHTVVGIETGIPVIHGEMLLKYGKQGLDSDTLASLKDILFNGTCLYQWDPSRLNRGEARGVLAGGNLSLLSAMLGAGLAGYLKGKILFIEETGEQLYRIDRMMMSLKLAGVFKSIKGLIVGGITDIVATDVPFGKSVQDIVMEAISGANIPVAFDFPAGHQDNNVAFYLGREVLFRVDELSAALVCP